VIRAGAAIQICDIQENSINYNIPQLVEQVSKDTLGIIVSHLFGIPSEIDAFVLKARQEGTFIIEDCAQALGATLNGRKLGTLGDIAFFSFGRGKTIYAISGGVIITNDHRIGRAVARRISRLPSPSLLRSLEALLIGFFVYVFSNPYVYWLPANLPFLELGKTIYPADFTVELMPGFNAGLARSWATKLQNLNKSRRILSQVYKEDLAPYGFHFLKEPAAAEAVYPRFPVIARTPTERESIHRLLTEMGMGSSCQYPAGVAHIPQLQLSEKERRRFINADSLSRLLITLPTHSDVSQLDVKKIIRIFKENETVALRKLLPVSREM
jgi:dTDP-4-amino-4,6-dideoxygalactose transaminase